uniref:PH domain-containing protein n=1 Tax=Hucho hucho TaxID=62062 RepID=A0A4W5LQR1_9TELE
MLMGAGRDTARDEAQKLHRKWLKHQAFMTELARNKEWLAKIEQEGQELIDEKPELRSVVQQKLEEIRECWTDLESTTKAKARALFENNKPEPVVKSYSDLDHQLSGLEKQPPQLEQAHHLPTFNEQLHKFQSQMGDLYKDVGELGSLQGVCLPQRGSLVKGGEGEGGEQPAVVETRIVRLIEPLKERRRILLASKEMHQVTVTDDNLLMLYVQQHVKINQGRRARVEEVLDRAGIIASLRTPEVDFVREGAGHVRQLWEVLRLEAERRSVMLDVVLQAQQYYSEAAKVESWLAGQKLNLISEEKGMDEASTLQLLKEHLALEAMVENYAETVGMLSQQCQRHLELAHPDSEGITKQQSHIDRLYVSLKDMVEHRKTKMEQQYWMYQLNREVEELEKWITEREAVASSTELGQDLEDVTMLQEKFTKFCSETNSIGQQRMEQVNKMVNEMIDCGHTDAATIAEWKDGLNESWADLLELMETRAQMLTASYQLHKFFTDCKEVLVQIAGKMRQLPEVRACQASIANPATLQRLMRSFEHALQLLVSQVRQLQENAAQLRAIYAGEKAEAIMSKEQEVMSAWKELLVSCEASRVQVTSVTDKVQFFSVVREHLMWMEGIMGQIGGDDPRDSSSAEVMMKQHGELKAKMDGRSKTLQQCVELGKILLAAGNPAAEEHAHLFFFSTEKDQFQYAQETVKAEAWLKAKEPLINSREAQAQTDEVEQLILRHEAFRKAAATWKERFSSLRQLSNVSSSLDRYRQSTVMYHWLVIVGTVWWQRETYRPTSSLSAPVTYERPRARDRPKPRRRPRPKEPEEKRRSRSAPAQSPAQLLPPSHTAHNEGFLYRKHDFEGQQKSPSRWSWVNLYCVLSKGEIIFYKDAKSITTPYNEETPLDLSVCICDSTMGYKKKKNVFVIKYGLMKRIFFYSNLLLIIAYIYFEDLKAWVTNITTSITEHEEIAKWDKPTTSSTDPDRSERKEKSEGDADARSERSEMGGEVEEEERSEKDRSEKGEGSEKTGEGSEKADTSERGEMAEGGAGGSSTSGKSK